MLKKEDVPTTSEHGCDDCGVAPPRLGSLQDRCEVHSAAIVHPHGHGHHHPDHSHGAHHRELDRRRLILSLTITGVILVAEVIGGLLSGSLALLSDAGHMLTDVSAQVLSLLALL